MYSELTKTIQVLQLLNNDVKITAGDKPLGTFRVKNVSVSDDGESTLKFESMADAVEMDNLNSLINLENEVAIVMESVVDLEDGNEEVEEDDNDEVEEIEEIEDETEGDEDWDDEDWGEDDNE
jgi:Asp-tRNA(Asn)/Glu-tRNA(Gln) amidotransferase B subunit